MNKTGSALRDVRKRYTLLHLLVILASLTPVILSLETGNPYFTSQSTDHDAFHANLADSTGPPDDSHKGTCRCTPFDPCWPSPTTWSAFNASLSGRLIATTPLAAPCHLDPFTPYSAAACRQLRREWLYPEVHYQSSSSIMAPFFANRSCDPFLPKHDRCIVGTYVQYAVNVSRVAHIQRAIAFARRHNIRLVIRNTGHDYNGKSTGAFALAIWTHHLTSLAHLPAYTTPHYTGPAVRLAAGVQALSAYAFAHSHGLRLVGGECPSVGLAGGYTQGGGHSALASAYGLAADQALAWEVVGGDGVLRTATRGGEFGDLFWALGGGGGGTYGVVVAVTVKAHEDGPVSGANLTFGSKGVRQEEYYEAVETYHRSLPAIVDAGAVSVWYFTNASFTISPLTGPGVPAEELRRLMRPLTDKLEQLGIKYTQVVRQFGSFLEQYNAMQAPIEVGIAQYGGRLIPRAVVERNSSALTAAYRYINNHGGQFIGVGLNVGKDVAGDVDNAVLPAWRTTLIDTVLTTPWNFTAPLEEMIANQRKMTDVLVPQLEALTPGGGCYLNEGNFRQPDFEHVFYGENYARLRRIKAKYDPYDLFFATTAVGSNEWVQKRDGRLCKKAK